MQDQPSTSNQLHEIQLEYSIFQRLYHVKIGESVNFHHLGNGQERVCIAVTVNDRASMNPTVKHGEHVERYIAQAMPV